MNRRAPQPSVLPSVLLLLAVLGTGCGDDSPRCSFDSSGLPTSYDQCVATGGTVVPATDQEPTFCVMTYPEYDQDGTHYNQCRAAGGYWFTYDVWCPPPRGTIGGTLCQVFYLQNECPTGQVPLGYSWPLPSCG